MEKRIRKGAEVDVLSYLNLGKMPPILDKKDDRIWIKAIALVYKSDNSYDYAVVTRGEGSQPEVKKTFGGLHRISRIEDIYPFMFLDEKTLPLLKNRKDIFNYLESKGRNISLIKNLSDEDIKNITQYEMAKDNLKQLSL